MQQYKQLSLILGDAAICGFVEARKSAGFAVLKNQYRRLFHAVFF